MKHFIKLAVLVVLLFSVTNGFAKEGVRLEGVININNASTEQLMLLPGVGEAKASAIIEARKAKPLASKEDVLAIKGIGDKMWANWEKLVVFQGETTLREVPDGQKTAATQTKAP